MLYKIVVVIIFVTNNVHVQWSYSPWMMIKFSYWRKQRKRGLNARMGLGYRSDIPI